MKSVFEPTLKSATLKILLVEDDEVDVMNVRRAFKKGPIGVMSRSGLKRFFVGNTAETVLDALPCDVLVLKPGRYKTSVPRSSPSPRTGTTPPAPS